MGETLCTGNSDDYRIHNPGGPRVRGRGEADEGPEGRIEGGFLFVQLGMGDVRNLTVEIQLYELSVEISSHRSIFQ